MDILTGQFNDSYFPIMDGVGITAHNYAYWLNEKYGRSVLVAPKVKGYLDLAEYRVYRFKSVLLPGMNPYRIGLPLIDAKFKKKLKKKKFDLVHAHCPFVSGLVAAKIAAQRDIPLVATFHTKYREDFRRVINNDLFVDFMLKSTLDFYRRADLVFVPNHATGQTLTEYGYEGAYEIMPNGCDMPVPGREKRQKLKKAGMQLTGAVAGEFVLLFVGQHRWEKNVRMIIESLNLLNQYGTRFRMVFVGEGYAMKEMTEMVARFGLADRVVFLGPVTDRRLLQSVYAASHVLVFPSLYDNSPLVVQEAAAFGVPTVVVTGSSSAENFRDGKNGFLSENSAEDLAARLKKLANNRTLVRQAGEGARKTLYQPWEGIVDRVYERYAELVRARVKPSSRQWEDDDDE